MDWARQLQAKRETCKFWNLVPFILEVWRFIISWLRCNCRIKPVLCHLRPTSRSWGSRIYHTRIFCHKNHPCQLMLIVLLNEMTHFHLSETALFADDVIYQRHLFEWKYLTVQYKFPCSPFYNTSWDNGSVPSGNKPLPCALVYIICIST